MPLYVQNGKLLKKGGTLGTSAGCCCQPPGCNCPLGPIQVPSSVTVVFSLQDFISTAFNGSCTHEDAVALIEGTYVLPQTAITSREVTYSITTESGATISFIWNCSDFNGLGGDYKTAEFSFLFCDISATCFARVILISDIRSGTLLPLCEYPTNSSDSTTFLSDPARVFLEQGPFLFSCTQSRGLTGRNYYYSLEITAGW